MKGTRADVRLLELGLAESREKARSLIMAGAVYADGIRVSKAGESIGDAQALTLKEQGLPFVSRGGLKLDKAVRKYAIPLAGAVAADVGASTGGFTDCMLQNGAARVYAIDVGYGQLDWRLRNDPRVRVMERTNARNMCPAWFDQPLDFAGMDVSFISVKLILPGLYACLKEGALAAILVKPQFEAGRAKVGKHGVVREKSTHFEVLYATALFARQLGFAVCEADFSPITGPKGNIEFLLILQKSREGDVRCDKQECRLQHDENVRCDKLECRIQHVVEEAHACFNFG
ncbi:MAG: TlyA family RNA methyltransferase [Christensenellaceae bacterium]|jgi:23S rRNA (cytidine1920-2'-O)/16S rRNA (cytidine1409-2'-O)-methyltransferase|nr:TlyA family RNA methyltransferase [Christensenellaceae bacterium]